MQKCDQSEKTSNQTLMKELLPALVTFVQPVQCALHSCPFNAIFKSRSLVVVEILERMNEGIV